MFAIQVQFNEKKNTIKVHGVGKKPTAGEKNIAGETVNKLQDILSNNSHGAKFTSDVKITPTKNQTAPTDTTEGMPPELAELLASLGAGSPLRA